MQEKIDNIENPKIQNMIKNISLKVKNLPMENSDIQQEFLSAIWIYFKETPIENRSMGAVRRVINQKLYRLIRQNIKFEGCSDRSKSIRRALNMPFSLDQPIFPDSRSGDSFDDENSCTLQNIISSKTEFNHLDQMSLIDSVKNFKQQLTSAELSIFNLMLEGINKPRFVCENLYGKKNVNEKKCKNISKHMINIKSKFKKYWSTEYGKRIESNRRSSN